VWRIKHTVPVGGAYPAMRPGTGECPTASVSTHLPYHAESEGGSTGVATSLPPPDAAGAGRDLRGGHGASPPPVRGRACAAGTCPRRRCDLHSQCHTTYRSIHVVWNRRCSSQLRLGVAAGAIRCATHRLLRSLRSRPRDRHKIRPYRVAPGDACCQSGGPAGADAPVALSDERSRPTGLRAACGAARSPRNCTGDPGQSVALPAEAGGTTLDVASRSQTCSGR
jgi:hypothetical protein